MYLAVPNLSCCLWDLVLWPGVKPGSPALGAWRLNHWTSREVLVSVFWRILFSLLLSRGCHGVGRSSRWCWRQGGEGYWEQTMKEQHSRRPWRPTPVFLHGESIAMDRGAYRATLHEAAKSQTWLKRLRMHENCRLIYLPICFNSPSISQSEVFSFISE